MDECKRVGIFCKSIFRGKAIIEDLDRGDGTHFTIFPVNEGDRFFGVKDIDKAYVLDDVSYREILYRVRPCLKENGYIMIGDGSTWINLSMILRAIDI